MQPVILTSISCDVSPFLDLVIFSTYLIVCSHDLWFRSKRCPIITCKHFYFPWWRDTYPSFSLLRFSFQPSHFQLLQLFYSKHDTQQGLPDCHISLHFLKLWGIVIINYIIINESRMTQHDSVFNLYLYLPLQMKIN